MQAAAGPFPAASGSPFPATTGYYPPATQSRPIPQHLIDSATLMRVLGHGMEKLKVSNMIPRFKTLLPIVDAYMRDRTHQHTYYANGELDRTYMDQTDFGKAHCLSLFDMEILLRYLVLVDKIHAFVSAKMGFCCFNRPFDRRDFSETWTKANLIDLDSYMRGIKQIPELPADFTEDEKANLKEAASHIEMGNYSRYTYHREEAIMLPLLYKGEESHRWLNFLLKAGAISSWNVAEGTEKIFVKICAADEAMEVATGRGWKWKEWKTLGSISKS